MDYKNLIQQVQSIEQLHKIKANLIGKEGEITKKVKELINFSIEERKILGKELNILKSEVECLIKEKEEKLKNKTELVDCSYMKNFCIGKKHLITQSIELLNQLFEDMGFEQIIGPDIEDPYYNFDALNTPVHHPARDNNDTFYMEDGKLLRTQVTAVQIRLLEKMKNDEKDIRAYSIGRVYRNDTHDATHSCMFHQIEGIILEEGVTMQHMKGFLEYILSNFFEKEIKVAFQPSFFPFTEPSCEVYAYENGKVLEIGGCGIIHPNILKNFNKEGKQAFAFGMGLERFIMLKYGLENLNVLYENHIPYLRVK